MTKGIAILGATALMLTACVVVPPADSGGGSRFCAPRASRSRLRLRAQRSPPLPEATRSARSSLQI